MTLALIDPRSYKVLSTLPNNNSLARIYTRIQIYGEAPYQAAKAQKWKPFAKEITRISGGKPLHFELDMDMQSEDGDPLENFEEPNEGHVKPLYDYIAGELGSLLASESIDVEFKNELTLLAEPSGSEDNFAESDSDIY